MLSPSAAVLGIFLGTRTRKYAQCPVLGAMVFFLWTRAVFVLKWDAHAGRQRLRLIARFEAYSDAPGSNHVLPLRSDPSERSFFFPALGLSRGSEHISLPHLRLPPSASAFRLRLPFPLPPPAFAFRRPPLDSATACRLIFGIVILLRLIPSACLWMGNLFFIPLSIMILLLCFRH